MNTKYLQQFERYYNGEMGPEEKASFENSLSESPEMNASFKEYLGIYEALSDRDTLDLRIKLKELRDERARMNNNNFFIQKYNWLWVAALITVILGITVVTSLMIGRAEWRKQMAAEVKLEDISEYSDLNRELMRYAQRDNDFKLESPGDSVFINRNTVLNFKWTVNSTDNLLLELINWHGDIIYSSGKPVISPYRVNMKLPPGILAYRFRTDTEAYLIGFLFLK
jgi:hypothetical protein